MNLDDLAELIRQRLGIGLPDMLRQRIADSFADGGEQLAARLCARLCAEDYRGAHWQSLIGQVTVGETHFFRHREWFSALERRALRSLIEAKRRRGERRLRLWSAGCSTGEEAYSLAIAVDRLLPDAADWDVLVLGSDLNQQALEQARRGLYRDWVLRELSAAEREIYFRAVHGGLSELRAGIRSRVAFQPLNLAAFGRGEETPGGPFDLVVCRNVLIYLIGDAQKEVCRALAAAVSPGGWLAVAPAEAVPGWFRPLSPVHEPPGIFFTMASAAPKAAPRRQKFMEARLPKAVQPVHPPQSPPPPSLASIRAAADAGRHQAARADCETYLKRHHFDTDGHLLLAEICLEGGDLAGALASARAALYLDPNAASAHFLAGASLIRLGDTEAGIKAMWTVLRLLKANASLDERSAMLKRGAEAYLPDREAKHDRLH